MLIIDGHESVIAEHELLQAFEQLYIAAFPDENERENFDDILNRVHHLNPLRTVLLIYVIENQPAGGMIIDVYENRFFHIVYIVVNPALRNQGLAKKLIRAELQKYVASVNDETDGVFLETNIPWMTTRDSFDPATRLKIFRGLGIKWIPIHYIQPALSIEKAIVRNLFLLYYPFDSKKTELKADTILNFLTLFYKGLNVDPNHSKEFFEMKNEINSSNNKNNSIMLKEIPTKEKSEYRFNNASICIQLSNENPNKTDKGLCEFFHSYETDLLSYHFQRERPFTSRYISELSNLKIWVHFPESYCIHSEGRTQTFANERQHIKARISISQTDFHVSENIVWSLVLMNDEADYFSELEIIKLSAYFAGSQERTNLKDELRFSTDGKNPLVLEDFLKLVLRLTAQEVKIGSGILQFDTANIECHTDLELDWNTFYTITSDALSKDSPELQLLSEKYNGNEAFANFLNLMCGLVLGIFDFKRIGFDEVVDTLKLIKGHQNFMLFLNRGIMLNLCHEDEMFETLSKNIGISPYFIIPNAVLNNNTYYLEKSLKRLKQLDFKSASNKELMEERNYAELVINEKVISTVFHYNSDKYIYGLCSEERNHSVITNKISACLLEINQLLEERKSNRESKSDLFMTLLLTVMSCLQFQGIFQSIANDNFMMSWVYTITFSISITAVIYYLLRMKN